MADVTVALGISKDVWNAIPEDYRQKITKAIGEGQIDVAKQLLAKILEKGNPTKEKKEFNPIEKACLDAFDIGFFGDRHWNMNKFIMICEQRGLAGSDVWSQKMLSLPLGLFERESKDIEVKTIDEILNRFAEAIDFDRNAIKQHFYAIRFNYADKFLADVEKKEAKRRKIEELALEAESEEISIPEEFREEEEE